jgi:hypothetical protein
MSAEPADYIHNNIEFQQAIAKWQNSGGTFGVAYAMLCAAYGRGGAGQDSVADEARSVVPDASPQNAAEGQKTIADEAMHEVPDAAAERSGEGQSTGADEARRHVPGSASSRLLPGHARHGMASISAVQGTMSKSLFDRIKLPDGRTLREVRWSECPNLATRYRRLSRILMALWAHGKPVDPNTTVDNLINDAGLKQIVDAVEKFNDIH